MKKEQKIMNMKEWVSKIFARICIRHKYKQKYYALKHTQQINEEYIGFSSNEFLLLVERFTRSHSNWILINFFRKNFRWFIHSSALRHH